ncbi:DnaD domain-containing protein [Agrilactobacillus fermenti]|uniref:DnaD domain-containing protein n=1 Tax=Agrilactobacillus fermenti TaxID=2586909 RepID=UPI001E64536E|nr:DnaD domain protein [Agrilactobacillus fermenti]MCD2255847.1 DnaD domain protein [Agrilactobacillus fermenti]
MADFSEALLEHGNTSVPNLLLEHIGQLSISGDELLLYLTLLRFHDQKIDFPSTQQIASALGWPQNQIFQVLQQLINKQFVLIETKEDPTAHVQTDHYNLLPLFRRLKLVLEQAQQTDSQKQVQLKRQNLFKQIEVEFNRVLSPIEIQTIDAWLNQDHYDPDLIELALREAVLNQVYSLKYMDRILLTWEKKNIRTKEQVQREKDMRNQY